MARYLKYTVREGDTLQSISQSTTDDINNWITIAEYNNLEYPYIVETTKEKVANVSHLVTWGDEIILPFPIESLELSALNINRQDKDEIENIALGTDLNINIIGEGSWDGIYRLSSNGHGDIEISSGMDNIKQAVLNRLLTGKGSLEGHPDFGSDIERDIGLHTSNTLQMINNDISKAILSDSRITAVNVSNSSILGDTYNGKWQVTVEGLDTAFEWVFSRDSSGNFTLE